MLIIGAGGHAKEVLEVLTSNGETELKFYDDLTINGPENIYNWFPILKSEAAARAYLTATDNRFVLAVGGPKLRQRLAEKFVALSGTLSSIISKTAHISQFDVSIKAGCNIMQQVIIQPSVLIGKGALINAKTIIHHDTIIGEYCEIAPSVTITGRCNIGDMAFIGTGAILMPGITIGKNVVVGAGAVVTKDVHENETVVGVPARVKTR